MTRELEASRDCTATVTHVCRLRFRNGQMIAAQVEAYASHCDSPVTYSGAVSLLPFRYPTASPVVLRAIFQSFARELHAQFEEESFGDFNLELDRDAYPSPQA